MRSVRNSCASFLVLDQSQLDLNHSQTNTCSGLNWYLFIIRTVRSVRWPLLVRNNFGNCSVVIRFSLQQCLTDYMRYVDVLTYVIHVLYTCFWRCPMRRNWAFNFYSLFEGMDIFPKDDRHLVGLLEDPRCGINFLYQHWVEVSMAWVWAP